MEEMIQQGEVDALIDLSLHEIADHFFRGDYDAGPDRGTAALQKKIPTILVPGNIDFLVTGPLAQAQRDFPGRKFHVHNAAITVVRTERREIEELAGMLAEKCNKAKGPVALAVPLGGFSAFDAPQGPLHDPEAPHLFCETVKRKLKKKIPLLDLEYHINDPGFSLHLVRTLGELLKYSNPS